MKKRKTNFLVQNDRREWPSDVKQGGAAADQNKPFRAQFNDQRE